MSLLTSILGLPEKLLMLIFAFVALFVVSMLATWFPGFGNWFWGVGLIAAAVFLPAVDLVKTNRFTLTLGSIAALLGIGILVFNILTVNLPNFGFSVIAMVSQPVAQSVFFGIDTATLDPTMIFLALVITTVVLIVAKKLVFKRRR